jgi:hypothetical protein
MYFDPKPLAQVLPLVNLTDCLVPSISHVPSPSRSLLLGPKNGLVLVYAE